MNSENDTAGVEGPTDAGDISVQIDWTPKRPKWPLAVAVLFVGAFLVGLWFVFFNVKVDLRKVLIAVETEFVEGKRGAWWAGDGKISGRYADALAEHLEKLGLEPVAGGDPTILEEMEETASLEEILAVAKSHGARWVMSGTIGVAKTMAIKGDDENRKDYVFHSSLKLHDTTGELGPTEIPLMAPEFFLAWQSDPASALGEHNLGLLVDTQVADIAAAITATTAIAPYASTDQKGSEDVILASKLQPLFGLARRYENAVDKLRSDRVDREKTEHKDRPSPSTHRLSPVTGSERFIGIATGSDIVTLSDQRSPYFHHKDGRLRTDDGLDELVLVSENGKERRSLFQAYNIYSTPRVSRDGKWVAVVVDHHDMAASLMRVSTETGEATELLFLENQEIRKPIPSPSGAQVAFLIAKCRRCNTSLELVTVGETKTRTILRPEDFAGTQMPVWSLDEKTLYLAMERESPQSVWAADVATGKLTPLLGAAVSEPVIPTEDSTTDDSAKTDEGADDWQEDGDEDDDEDDGAEPAVTFSNIDVSPDGGRLVVTKRGNDGVYQMVEFDLKTKQVKKLVDDDGWGTKYSLDGTRIGYTTQYNTHAKDYHGDEEVAVVDLKTQKLETLTVNSRDDIFRGFSRSSKRIYYSARRYVREFSYLGRGSRATWIYWIEL